MVSLAQTTLGDLPTPDLLNAYLRVLEDIKSADAQALLEGTETGLAILAIVYGFVFPIIALILGAVTVLILRSSNHLPRFLHLGKLFKTSDDATLGNPDDLESYLEKVQVELPRLMMLLLVIGLVPFLGLVLGLAFYCHSPVAALAKKVKGADLGSLRWILPVITLGLIGAQPLPVLGPLSVPLLCAAHHGAYDAVLRRRLRRPARQIG